ncbi:RHS repeat-associated core domain-containing protein [Geobacter anodireducens]
MRLTAILNVVLRAPFLLCLLHVLIVGAASADHRDLAPIPEEVIERVARERHAQDDSLVASLEHHLDEVTELLGQIGDASIDTSGATMANSKRVSLAAKANEVEALRSDVRSRFDETRQRFVSLGLDDKVTELDALREKVEARFNLLERVLGDVVRAKNSTAQGNALTKAKELLLGLHGKRMEREQSLGNQPITTWTLDSRQHIETIIEHAAPPVYLSSQPPSRSSLYAFAGTTFLAAAPESTPAEALSCGYTAADLSESQEIQLTPEIRALAGKLGYSPARIFEYVSNEIRFEPYYGSLKGATGALIASGGGPTDQASLLIALLRASNIPARYVKGIVYMKDDPRLLTWVGAKGYDGAFWMLGLGGAKVYSDGSDGKLAFFDHVWVEACVPYAHYRGARLDNAGHRWIPLDPSFKDKNYQAGITTGVAFDYTSYLASRSNVLPHEAFEKRIEEYLWANMPNAALEDVPYAGRAVPKKIDILPASLPYEVYSFSAWDGGTGPSDTAEVPDKHRYKFAITVKNSGGTTLANTSLSLPETVLKRATLSFKGATPTDQTALNAWQGDSNPDSAIPCSINVVPVIKSDGADLTSGTTSVGLCTENNQLILTVSRAESSVPTVNTVTYQNIKAADYHALQAYAFQASDRLLAERAARLLNSVRTTSSPNLNLEETEGEFLHLVGLKYMRYISDAAKRIGSLSGESGESGNHLGLVSSRMKVRYLFDLPFAVSRSGFLIDVPGGLSRSRNLATGTSSWEIFKLSGYSSSAYESYIWQENGRFDAVSTVRGLQFAKETGIEVLTLTSANWSVAGDTACANVSSQCYKFTHNANSTLNYAPSQVSSIKANYIDQGFTVVIPRSLIQYENWKGSVFVGEKNDTATGAMYGSYAINQYAGGYTVSNPITYSYTPSLDTGYMYVSPTAGSTLPPVYVGNGSVGLGLTPYNTFGGDPVNLVTGNMYHVERDLTIKGRGDFPIVFERSYNSRSPQDGPLGFGWTHSFNHYLTFRDDNQNGTNDAGDSDGITSAVSWTDGTGSEKYIQVAGTSGGIPVGSAFTPPKGFHFQVAREANGTYTVTEKNGLTYNFESVAGTVGQKAKLLSIRDRNSNTLTMGYTGGNLTSITDGAGRSLNLTVVGNRITEVRDWSGRTRTYDYDANGNLWKYRNPLAVAGNQNPVVYEYYTTADGQNLNHAMKRIILPRGNTMTYEYYANGRAFRHYNAKGDTSTFTYNEFRRETVHVNERGKTRRFLFDEYGNPETVIEENGARRHFTYDPANPYNRLSERTPQGFVTGYAYDTSGNVTRITKPSLATVEFSHHNPFGRPGKVKDANSNYTLYKYDSRGNLLAEIRLKKGVGAAIDPASYVPVAGDIIAWTVNGYDSFGNLQTARRVRNFAAQIATPTSRTGPTVEYDYNDTVNAIQGLNAVTITRRGDKDGDGTVSDSEYDTATLAYDTLGRVIAGIDADWHPTEFHYDPLDRVERGSDALGQLRDYAYDANGNATGGQLVATVNGLPTLVDSWCAAFDDADRKESHTDAGGFTTRYRYDAAGNPDEVTNPDGYTLGFAYDDANRVIWAYDQENNAVTRTLDPDGNPRTITDPNGTTVTREYHDKTRDGRLKRVVQPKIQSFAQGRAEEYDYDANGNIIVTSEIPADGSAPRTTRTDYDELNRPTRVAGPAYTDATLGLIRPVTRYAYDTLGNLFQVSAGRTDATGTNPASDVVSVQATYAYDDFGRRLRETDPLNKSWHFEYDMHGNVTKATDPKGQIIRNRWDYGHQLVGRTNDTESFVYASYTRNPLGQIIAAITPEVTYRYGYDAAHRLTSVTDSRGNKTLTYDWSPGGLLNWVMDSDGNRTDYDYDPTGRLSGIWAANFDYVTFRYDPGGRLTEKWFPNGVTTRYGYNADNSLKQVVNRTDTNTIVSQHDYTYDAYGNRSLHTEKIDATTTPYQYVYDELHRLTEVRDNSTASLIEGYSYDPLNNRLTRATGTTTYHYLHNDANQLTEAREGSPTGPLVASFSYDDNGNLSTKSEGTTTTVLAWDVLNRLASVNKTGILAESYTYDDQGRRIATTVAGVTTSYLYAGPDIYGEYADWTTATALYTHGPRMDDPLIRATATGALYYHQDGLGSVVAVTDPAKTVSGVTRYDAWGNVIAATGAIPQYGYTGREPDTTGLVYYRARYYDPSTGTFIQKDPIGLTGGVNPYAYVQNNPVNLTDPEGLLPVGSVQVADSSYFSNWGSDAGNGIIQNNPINKIDSLGFTPPEYILGKGYISGPGGPAATAVGAAGGVIGAGVGAAAGTRAGMYLGMEYGATLGLPAGPLGSFAGALLGGAIGYLGGGISGEIIGGELGAMIGSVFDKDGAGELNYLEPNPNKLEPIRCH